MANDTAGAPAPRQLCRDSFVTSREQDSMQNVTQFNSEFNECAFSSRGAAPSRGLPMSRRRGVSVSVVPSKQRENERERERESGSQSARSIGGPVSCLLFDPAAGGRFVVLSLLLHAFLLISLPLVH